LVKTICWSDMVDWGWKRAFVYATEGVNRGAEAIGALRRALELCWPRRAVRDNIPVPQVRTSRYSFVQDQDTYRLIVRNWRKGEVTERSELISLGAGA
jgi:hypothetical protein